MTETLDTEHSGGYAEQAEDNLNRTAGNNRLFTTTTPQPQRRHSPISLYVTRPQVGGSSNGMTSHITTPVVVTSSSSSFVSSSINSDEHEQLSTSSAHDDVEGLMTSTTDNQQSPCVGLGGGSKVVEAGRLSTAFSLGGDKLSTASQWKSSDEEEEQSGGSKIGLERHRRKFAYKRSSNSMNRRWTSHSSTYPSSCTTNSFPRSSTSDLSVAALDIKKEEGCNKEEGSNKEEEGCNSVGKLLGNNVQSKTTARRCLRSEVTTPKNIELYRQHFANWNNDDSDDVDSDKSGGIRFPPVIPPRHLLIINVSGRKFEVDMRRLNEHPETLLGDAKRRQHYWDSVRKEIFFDRHQKSFEAIHNYYMGLSQGGKLVRPEDVPLDIFLNEVRFYCFGRDAIRDFLENEGILLDKKVKLMPDTELKRVIWRIFEDHDSSWEARIITLLSAAIITLSVIVFCLETLPDFASLGEHFNSTLEPALTACIQHINRTSYPPILDHNNTMSDDDFIRDVIRRLDRCEQDSSLMNDHRYLTTRCLIHLKDVNNIPHLSEILWNITLKNITDDDELLVDPPTITTLDVVTVGEQVQQHQIRHPSQHQNRSKTEPQVVTTPQPQLRYGYSYTNDLVKVCGLCKELDENTTRSPYFWYVLESHMHLPAGIIFVIETSCIVWFVFEICLRFYCSPKRRSFFMNFLNIIDVLAILPYFITLLITTIAVESSLRPQTATILRTIRLVRMLRILKLSRYSRGFRILGLTLVRSTRVLFLLVCFQVVLAIFFSSIGYFVENETPGTKFTSIPESFWWALITMTTVGYGDICPITLWGKITGACCAIMGILSISFPVPVIVSNFNYLYNQDKDDCKLEPEELMNEDFGDDICGQQHAEIFSRFERFSNLKVRRETVKSTDEKIEKTPVLLWDLVKEHYTKKVTTSPTSSLKRASVPGCSDPSTSNRSDDVIQERVVHVMTSSDDGEFGDDVSTAAMTSRNNHRQQFTQF